MSSKKDLDLRKYEETLDQLKNKLEQDPVSRERACEWLREVVGDEAAGHLCNLSDNIKIQACIDHIKIGLASGDIDIDDIKKVFG
ncbi:hypothetical protein HOF40_01820 [Candidatus Parcubacteria bacterium]|jgi:hypothetical protein|nr:hypothetical protein [Candidatus Parcubacteria bacterium]